MESASIAADTPEGAHAGGKGLKSGALGELSNLVIGVASTAPAYSLAATLGFVVAVGGMGAHSPAIMIISFIPMLRRATTGSTGRTRIAARASPGSPAPWVPGWAGSPAGRSSSPMLS